MLSVGLADRTRSEEPKLQQRRAELDIGGKVFSIVY